MTIRSPVEWTGAQIAHAAHAVGSSLHHTQERLHSPAPAVRHIQTSDLKDALVKGFGDFTAYRTDVLFVVIMYPIIGLVASHVALRMNLVPLLFPLASGFALVGPIAGVGLYEMSRRREQGLKVSWSNGLDVIREPAFGAIAMLSLLLAGLFLAWVGIAWEIFHYTMGPAIGGQPASIGAFFHDAFMTGPGQTMVVTSFVVGFLFAVLALTISVVSFPLLVDRDVGLDTAVRTSFRAVKANPRPMAAWGLIVVAGLILGSLPFFVGLMVVLPVLGHATWHLYRKVVEPASRPRRV